MLGPAFTRIFIAALSLATLATQARADVLSSFCRYGFITFPGDVSFGAIYGDRDPCEFNESLLLPLASTTKILTAVTAFAQVDRSFRPLLDPTRPFDPRVTWREVIPGVRGVITQLELIGDGGDDEWIPARYAEVVSLLKAAGVTEIHGEIRARASDPRWNSLNRPEWPAEDVTLNKECGIYLPRAFKLGASGCPRVIVDGTDAAHWSNPNLKGTSIRFEDPRAPFSFHFDLGPPENESGGALVIQGKPPHSFNVLFRDSEKLATIEFRAALVGKFVFSSEEHRISSTQEVKGAPIRTRTLEVLLGHFLKNSDNFEGELLLRQIGIKSEDYDRRAGYPGHDALNDGRAAIFKYAKSLAPGVNERNLKIKDGCGLWPETSATPSAMIAALIGIRAHPRFSAFKELLVKPGAAPGTLQKRFFGLSGRLRAKTGTLPNGGVHNLLGFMLIDGANAKEAGNWIPFVALSKVNSHAYANEDPGAGALNAIDDVTKEFARLLRGPRPAPLP